MFDKKEELARLLAERSRIAEHRRDLAAESLALRQQSSEISKALQSEQIRKILDSGSLAGVHFPRMNWRQADRLKSDLMRDVYDHQAEAVKLAIMIKNLAHSKAAIVNKIREQGLDPADFLTLSRSIFDY